MRASRAAAGGLRLELVSVLTVNRLSVYLRSLRALEARGVRSVSSHQLAEEFNLSASQIRKDLAQFGEFGVRGVGYGVAELAAKISHLLGLDLSRRVVIVGMGNLGTALARYPSFNAESFLVVAGVDSDPGKTGRKVGRVPVHSRRDLARVIAESGATMAILAVPADAAPAAHAELAAAGIRAVLNFAPVSLPSTRTCRVKNLDLRVHLEELAFFLEDGDGS
ncbi:MAG TPA: redox-sensing transcriptional repressor Rex [Thermoanaerobaculia bacterium]|jgi:redox-sensing transcriptional repressor